uniref:DUF262 domain-containing protein n=1 Tax=uncultured Halomonas sp. TaxID=173971 RepID=UPI002621E927|nr:DUF262 domain-containing protein [uncultured Halomonas sp.]
MSRKDSRLLDSFVDAQKSLVTQQSDFSLSSIREMVEGGAIDLSPSYQRRERWKEVKQSKLIESFLLNVPIPPVYLSEDDYGHYSVIDGKQRITSINNFMSGKLKLSSLESLPVLNGMTFFDLPKEIKNALTIRPYVRAITLLRQSDLDLKYEVFLRLNTGGESLKAQEIRNVAFSGPLNDALLELSKNPVLMEGLKIHSQSSAAYRNMDDVEHVLRYFTIRDHWEKMKGALASEMDDYMKENRSLPKKDVEAMINDFNRSISFCKDIFGEHVFNKPVKSGWRDQLISPLYDAQMVAMSLLSDISLNSLKSKKSGALKCVKILYDCSEFNRSVSQATNTPSSIRKRIEMMVAALREIA